MRRLLASLLLGSVAVGAAAAAERFACNMNALTSGERARHHELSRSLFAAVEATSELPNGYAFRLPPAKIVSAAEWISFERKCCPFFAFELEQAKDGGPLWLRITGSEGVKPFIVEEFQL